MNLNNLALRFLVDRLGNTSRSRLSRHLNQHALQRRLKELQGKGVALDVIYDIGAHKGDWSVTFSRAFPRAQFLLFEANGEMEPFLQKTGYRYFLSPLSCEEKIVDFYHKGSTGDSYFKENTRVYDSIAPEKRRTMTLDIVCEQNNLPAPDLIKLDTQGSELDILQGGQIAMQNASMIYAECPVIEYNIGSPNIHDYISTFLHYGFLPHNIFEIHDIFGILVQIDVLFIRRDLIFKLYPSSEKFFTGLSNSSSV